MTPSDAAGGLRAPAKPTTATDRSAEPPGSGVAEEPSGRRRRVATRLFGISVLSAVVPIAVAAARAIARGWIPTGDDAQLALRSVDVFSTHLPLLGSWSSSSASYGVNVNNPGPLMFDALSVPAKLFGASAGTAIGVAAINIVAVLGIAWFAWRRGGPALGITAMVVATALAWSMGSELLYEPWQPHSLMLPFVLFLFVTWSAVSGDVIAIPVAALVGSYLLETHLSYAIIVPVLSVWALGGWSVALRSARRRDPDGWPMLRRRATGAVVLAGVALVVLWAQPIIEQLTSSPPGNVTRLVRASRAHVTTVGVQLGAKLVAAVASLPPFWFRPGTEHTFEGLSVWRPPSGLVAVASLATLLAILGLCAWAARRHDDRTMLGALATSALLLAVALVTAAKTPVTVFGAYDAHELRWLWPISAFVFFTIAASLVRRVPPPRATAIVSVLTLTAVVLAALNLPTATVGDTPQRQQYAIPALKRLDASMGDLSHRGPLLIDDLFTEEFALYDPFGWGVLAELQRRNIPFVAADPGLVRQLGPGRQFTGHNAQAALLERKGSNALTPPPGSRRVAFGEGLSSGDLRELTTLQRQITSELQQHGVRLNRHGETALLRGQLALYLSPGSDVAALVNSGDFAALLSQRDVIVDPVWARRYARYATLQAAFNAQTVALFIAPVSAVRAHKT